MRDGDGVRPMTPPEQTAGQVPEGAPERFMGLEDMLAIVRGMAGQDIAKLFITGSTKPEEMFARTRLTPEDLKRKQRIYLRRNAMLRGGSLYGVKEMIDLIGRLSLDGKARSEVIEILTHMPLFQKPDMMQRMLDRTHGSNDRGPAR